MVLWFAIACAGCEGTITGPVPTAPPPRGYDAPELPSTASCSTSTSGRGYRGMAGEPLEADRADVEALADVDRPYRVWMINYSTWNLVPDVQRAAGVATAGFDDDERNDPAVAASFGVAPHHWYTESEVGSFAVFTTFEYAFSVCRRVIVQPPAGSRAGWYEHTASAPTEASARAYCERTQRSAWLRAPSPVEVQHCVELALSLDDEPDLASRWSYVCASIFTSANFLSY